MSNDVVVYVACQLGSENVEEVKIWLTIYNVGWTVAAMSTSTISFVGFMTSVVPNVEAEPPKNDNDIIFTEDLFVF